MSAAEARDHRIAEGAAMIGKPMTIHLRPQTYDELARHPNFYDVLRCLYGQKIALVRLADER